MLSQSSTIASIGKTARDWLVSSNTAIVSGITSRGVFLMLPDERVVFLSGEPFRGPLTLNLAGDWGQLTQVALHTSAHLVPGSIAFPSNRLSYSYVNAVEWEAPPPAGDPVPHHQIVDRMRAVTQAALAGRIPDPLAAALPALLGETPVANGLATVQADLEGLRELLWIGNAPAISAVLESFLGRGSGLTPSGDDLVMGVLLTLSRWGPRLATVVDMPALVESLLTAARRRTTALSACLIACAAGGQADERLITALDGMVTGAAEIEACANSLSGWGSSSGTDALAGMAVTLMALKMDDIHT